MTVAITRQELATHVLKRLETNVEAAKQAYHGGHKINSFIVDDLLPVSAARLIYNSSPRKEEMMLKKSSRENKYVAAPYFYVTSFRGGPEEKMRDAVLQADIALRMGIRKVFKKGIVETLTSTR